MSQESRTFVIVLVLVAIAFAGILWWDWQRSRTTDADPNARATSDPPLSPSQQADLGERDRARSAPPEQGTCDHCGEAINGRRVRVAGLDYHPEHFLCAHCGEAIRGAYGVHEGGFVHPMCRVELTAQRCAVCEQPIVNAMAVEDFWGNFYHQAHELDVPRCEYCGRFFADSLGNVGRQYDDGRQICGICLETAVSDLSRLEELLEEVSRELAGLGMFVNHEWIQLHLVAQPRLDELAASLHARARGFTVFRAVDPRLDILKKQNRKVYILEGMPEMETRFALAHELAHIWQGEMGQLDSERAFREGSCNYAAYLLFQSLEHERARYIVHALSEDPDPIYGEGFRKVKRFAEDRGRAAWLDRLRTEDTLPVGY